MILGQSRNLVHLIPYVAILLLVWVSIVSLAADRQSAYQWPGRLLRFMLALATSIAVFGLIYLLGGLLVSRFGYTYQDPRLLRWANLICIIAAYPAGLASGIIFRTRHCGLVLGFILLALVHIADKMTYLGQMVFGDPSIPLNGDFALTNMSFLLIAVLLGAETGMRKGLSLAIVGTQRDDTPPEMGQNASLTSGGG